MSKSHFSKCAKERQMCERVSKMGYHMSCHILFIFHLIIYSYNDFYRFIISQRSG